MYDDYKKLGINIYCEDAIKRYTTFYNKKDQKSSVMFIGACTTRNMNRWINQYAMNLIDSIDPWENIFNPKLVLFELQRIADLSDDTIFSRDYNTNLYSDEIRNWIKGDKDYIVEQNRIHNIKLRQEIASTDYVYISFCSSETWRTDEKIYNKIPIQELEHGVKIVPDILTVNEMEFILQEIIKTLHKINPNINILFAITYPKLKASMAFKNLELASFKLINTIYTAIQNVCDDLYYPEYEITQHLLNSTHYKLQLDGRHLPANIISLLSKQFVYEVTNKTVAVDDSDFFIPGVDKFGKVVGRNYMEVKNHSD